ncbi:hypothetical protein [Sorangium sp. So ce1335]|uniref:hypothetical protein n=1 Tax=Sorangium sp. So ce1335 TaxID=3133335 RepID=UPI003F638CCB
MDALLGVGQAIADPSFWTVIAPMWIIAVDIVFANSVTANGALQRFGHVAGSSGKQAGGIIARSPSRAHPPA